MAALRTFYMREYIPDELKADPGANVESYLADKCRKLAIEQGGKPVGDPVIQWHEVAEGEQVPAIWRDLSEGMVLDDSTGESLVAAGDWRAIVTVKCETPS